MENADGRTQKRGTSTSVCPNAPIRKHRLAQRQVTTSVHHLANNEIIRPTPVHVNDIADQVRTVAAEVYQDGIGQCNAYKTNLIVKYEI